MHTRNQAIIVTLNYRLGVLGFLVTDESTAAGAGNGGMNGQCGNSVSVWQICLYVCTLG